MDGSTSHSNQQKPALFPEPATSNSNSCRSIWRVRKTIVAVALMAWSVASEASDVDLKNEIGKILVEEKLVGIAWALIDETGESGIGNAGVRDGRERLGFNSDTRFHVGSLTKTLLATGVLRLATEGRIDLDAQVIQYIPNLFPDRPSAGFSDVTIRHLLDHTSGLNDASLWQVFSERANANAQLMDAFPDPESQLQLRSDPGTRFSYSNIGYTLLGMVIENVVGERYESYLDDNLLDSLGMHICCDIREVNRMSASSGTTGTPTE